MIAAGKNTLKPFKKANKSVGYYHFFHPEIEIQQQFDNFDRQVSGFIATGDIVPAIDIESFGATHGVTPLWSAPVQALAQLFTAHYGKPLLYMGVNTWALMGKPPWVSDYPLWVPRYVYDGVMPPPPPINPLNCPCKKMQPSGKGVCQHCGVCFSMKR